MRILSFVVPEQYEKAKAMSFLRGHCSFSARLVNTLKRVDMGITRNGTLLRTIDILHAGDVVEVRIPDHATACQPEDIPIDIVFEDDDILIINKPPFLAMHPSGGHGSHTLANACAAHFAKSGRFDSFRPINRLDRDTTGLVAAAKNPHAAALLTKSLQKEYIAIAQGYIEQDMTIDAPLRKREGCGISLEVGEGGIRAVTHVQVVKRLANHTLVKLILETGRTHQIRVHLSSIGHPLAGDDMYGGSLEFINRQALHCRSLWFLHPVTGEDMRFTADIPEDMRLLADKG